MNVHIIFVFICVTTFIFLCVINMFEYKYRYLALCRSDDETTTLEMLAT